MRIFIDSREPNSIINEFKKLIPREWSCEVRQLELGDFLVPSKSLLIERKTFDDFLSSILDGRVFRQIETARAKYDRVFLCIGLDQSLGEKRKSRISSHAYLAAIASLANGSSIIMMPTKHLIYLIFKIIEKVNRENIRYHSILQSNYSEKQFLYSVLCCIPGIGDKTSSVLVKQYSGLKDLIDNIDQLDLLTGISKKRKDLIKKYLSS